MTFDAFDPTLLLLSLLTSGIGFVLFVYGKKQQRTPHLIAGVLFMVYSYFTNSVALTIGIGIVLGIALWWVVRMGY